MKLSMVLGGLMVWYWIFLTALVGSETGSSRRPPWGSVAMPSLFVHFVQQDQHDSPSNTYMHGQSLYFACALYSCVTGGLPGAMHELRLTVRLACIPLSSRGWT